MQQQNTPRFASVSIYYTTWAANVTAIATHRVNTGVLALTPPASIIIVLRKTITRSFTVFLRCWLSGFVSRTCGLYLYPRVFAKTLFFTAAAFLKCSRGMNLQRFLLYERHLFLDWNSANNPCAAVTCPKLNWVDIASLEDLLVHGKRSPGRGQAGLGTGRSSIWSFIGKKDCLV